MVSAITQPPERGTAFVADNGSNAKFAASNAIVDPTSCVVSTSSPSGTITLSGGNRGGRRQSPKCINSRKCGNAGPARPAYTATYAYDGLGRPASVTQRTAR